MGFSRVDVLWQGLLAEAEAAVFYLFTSLAGASVLSLFTSLAGASVLSLSFHFPCRG